MAHGIAVLAAAHLSLPAAASTFPEKVIRKSEAVHEWPFSIEEGTLTCVAYAGQRYVFFAEMLPPEEMGEFGNMRLPRSVVVTANPLVFFATIENRELYAPFDSLEVLIRRLAPYERSGRELCDGAGGARQDL